MLYPAPNAAGFIAAVITHGLLVESQKNSQKQALQDLADKILDPYRATLEGFKHPELMQKALEKTSWGGRSRLIAASEPKGSGWVVESVPAYAMTQDQRALVLDNSVSVYRPGESASPMYQATIRVVSQPRGDWDPQSFWLDRDLAALKEESSNLLAHSLDLAIREASGTPPAAQTVFKTVRYLEGSTEKMERAQVIMDRGCRQVIRTLRGWLMSVPLSPASDAPGKACEPALPGWQ
jgi:hypothetical protein